MSNVLPWGECSTHIIQAARATQICFLFDHVGLPIWVARGSAECGLPNSSTGTHEWDWDFRYDAIFTQPLAPTFNVRRIPENNTLVHSSKRQRGRVNTE